MSIEGRKGSRSTFFLLGDTLAGTTCITQHYLAGGVGVHLHGSDNRGSVFFVSYIEETRAYVEICAVASNGVPDAKGRTIQTIKVLGRSIFRVIGCHQYWLAEMQLNSRIETNE